MKIKKKCKDCKYWGHNQLCTLIPPDRLKVTATYLEGECTCMYDYVLEGIENYLKNHLEL